ncbi:MAG: hypothetical protein BA864_14555 [Desulfuromonadales bacterium C00003093]|nr:MAG: hypothetical protein BA864_14555 [Desulfuromonadales bacterium C00003093]
MWKYPVTIWDGCRCDGTGPSAPVLNRLLEKNDFYEGSRQSQYQTGVWRGALPGNGGEKEALIPFRFPPENAIIFGLSEER